MAHAEDAAAADTLRGPGLGWKLLSLPQPPPGVRPVCPGGGWDLVWWSVVCRCPCAGELHCAVWGSDWPPDDLSEDQFLATTAPTAPTAPHSSGDGDTDHLLLMLIMRRLHP